MKSTNQDRRYWIHTLERIARPVLHSLSEKKLKVNMPVEEKRDDRHHFTYLEALGRTLAGIAPWLETGAKTGEEGILREQYAQMARNAIDAATDPNSPDYMNFSSTHGRQPVVDAAFLAHAILRAPTELYETLQAPVKQNLASALKSTRSCYCGPNNWILFAAMVEAALFRMGEDWDLMRVEYAIRQHETWYLGDGMYGDGAHFHWDYYNSFVIQPMLVDVVLTFSELTYWKDVKENILKRASRYATVQERLISPEGTFPPIGRSLAYRFGALQHLAQTALQHRLPSDIEPAQVRCAMTAVIKRMMEAPGTFDENGWLTIGFCGHQPSIGEAYISTGSLYLCSTALLPLGLSEEDAFWSGAPCDWTSKKLWGGQDLMCDHAL